MSEDEYNYDDEYGGYDDPPENQEDEIEIRIENSFIEGEDYMNDK